MVSLNCFTFSFFVALTLSSESLCVSGRQLWHIPFFHKSPKSSETPKSPKPLPKSLHNPPQFPNWAAIPKYNPAFNMPNYPNLPRAAYPQYANFPGMRNVPRANLPPPFYLPANPNFLPRTTERQLFNLPFLPKWPFFNKHAESPKPASPAPSKSGKTQNLPPLSSSRGMPYYYPQFASFPAGMPDLNNMQRGTIERQLFSFPFPLPSFLKPNEEKPKSDKTNSDGTDHESPVPTFPSQFQNVPNFLPYRNPMPKMD